MAAKDSGGTFACPASLREFINVTTNLSNWLIRSVNSACFLCEELEPSDSILRTGYAQERESPRRTQLSQGVFLSHFNLRHSSATKHV